jgi:hypothetical protein
MSGEDVDAIPRVRFRLEGRVKKPPDGTEEHGAG